ncbi:hypothetical protein CDIK_3335 [Cucumispora dikerogammari]|nr:hypothetical protein CDIK_3335 [Cucumispora dikerogammari]
MTELITEPKTTETDHSSNETSSLTENNRPETEATSTITLLMPEENQPQPSNTRAEIPRPRRFAVSNDNRDRIITKTLKRYSVQAISQMYGKNYQTDNSIVKNYLKTEQVLPKKRCTIHELCCPST